MNCNYGGDLVHFIYHERGIKKANQLVIVVGGGEGSFISRGLHLRFCWGQEIYFPLLYVSATNRKENHSTSDRAKLPTTLHFHRDIAVSRKLTFANRAILLDSFLYVHVYIYTYIYSNPRRCFSEIGINERYSNGTSFIIRTGNGTINPTH